MFDDADIEAAAEAIAIAGYFNAGQDCTAATPRARRRRAPTTTSPPRSASRRRGGRPAIDDEEVLFGPLNNADQLSRVEGFMDRLPAHAGITNGGKRIGDRGYFFEPTVVDA